MSQVNKQHELTINISPGSRSNIITNTTFFTMDVRTAKKVINFTHESGPVDLTNAKVLIGFEFVGANASKIIDSEDGSIVIEDAVGGICGVILPNHLYDYEGQVLVHVYIKYEDGRSLDCGVIVTEFEESWLDRDLPQLSEFYVQRFEDLARALKERMAVAEEQLEDIESFRGPQGETGPRGPQGERGLTGATGPIGPQGERGLTGAGAQGPQGLRGETGATGPQGERGTTGPIGPQGIQGLTGERGAVGPQGATGPQGLRGEVGAVGPVGPQGERGATGPIGPQGLQGETGPQGPSGASGNSTFTTPSANATLLTLPTESGSYRIQTGRHTHATGTFAILFPVPYTSPPTVHLTIQDGNTLAIVRVSNVTVNGFNIVRSGGTGQTITQWFAQGV